jgi:hypothetical protein
MDSIETHGRVATAAPGTWTGGADLVRDSRRERRAAPGDLVPDVEEGMAGGYRRHRALATNRRRSR